MDEDARGQDMNDIFETRRALRGDPVEPSLDGNDRAPSANCVQKLARPLLKSGLCSRGHRGRRAQVPSCSRRQQKLARPLLKSGLCSRGHRRRRARVPSCRG